MVGTDFAQLAPSTINSLQIKSSIKTLPDAVAMLAGAPPLDDADDSDGGTALRLRGQVAEEIALPSCRQLVLRGRLLSA